jgi:hypothetical protein
MQDSVMVEVPQRYVEELEVQAAKYLALIDVGVENWSGYTEAMVAFTQEQQEA